MLLLLNFLAILRKEHSLSLSLMSASFWDRFFGFVLFLSSLLFCSIWGGSIGRQEPKQPLLSSTILKSQEILIYSVETIGYPLGKEMNLTPPSYHE